MKSLRRWLTRLIWLAFALLLTGLAIANDNIVSVSLNLFGLVGEMEVSVPLYAPAFAMLLIGIVMGGLVRFFR